MKHLYSCVLATLVVLGAVSLEAGGGKKRKHAIEGCAGKCGRCDEQDARRYLPSQSVQRYLEENRHQQLLDEWGEAPTEVCDIVSGMVCGFSKELHFNFVGPEPLQESLDWAYSVQTEDGFDRLLEQTVASHQDAGLVSFDGPNLFVLGEETWEKFVAVLATLPELRVVRIKFRDAKKNNLDPVFIMRTLARLPYIEVLADLGLNCCADYGDGRNLQSNVAFMDALAQWKNLRTLVISGPESSLCRVDLEAAVYFFKVIGELPELHTFAIYDFHVNEAFIPFFLEGFNYKKETYSHLHTFITNSFILTKDGSLFGFDLYFALKGIGYGRNDGAFFVAQRTEVECDQCLNTARPSGRSVFGLQGD